MSKKPTYQEIKDSNAKLQERIKSLEKRVKELEADQSERTESKPDNHSPEIFFKAFHSNPALMAISNFSDSTYIDVNNAFVEALGYKREEIIGVLRQLFVSLIKGVAVVTSQVAE